MFFFFLRINDGGRICNNGLERTHNTAENVELQILKTPADVLNPIFSKKWL